MLSDDIMQDLDDVLIRDQLSIKCSRTFQLVKCPDIDLVSPTLVMGLLALSEIFRLHILSDFSKVDFSQNQIL